MAGLQLGLLLSLVLFLSAPEPASTGTETAHCAVYCPTRCIGWSSSCTPTCEAACSRCCGGHKAGGFSFDPHGNTTSSCATSLACNATTIAVLTISAGLVLCCGLAIGVAAYCRFQRRRRRRLEAVPRHPHVAYQRIHNEPQSSNASLAGSEASGYIVHPYVMVPEGAASGHARYPPAFLQQAPQQPVLYAVPGGGAAWRADGSGRLVAAAPGAQHTPAGLVVPSPYGYGPMAAGPGAPQQAAFWPSPSQQRQPQQLPQPQHLSQPQQQHQAAGPPPSPQLQPRPPVSGAGKASPDPPESGA